MEFAHISKVNCTTFLLFHITFVSKQNSSFTELQDAELNSESRDDESDPTLPWSDPAELPNAMPSDDGVTSGEFVLRTLFAEFTIVAEQKIELVLAEPLVRILSATLDIKKYGCLFIKLSISIFYYLTSEGVEHAISS